MLWLEPAHHPHLPDDALHIWRATLDGQPVAVAQCAALLSSDEQARADRFVFAPDRDRYTLARGLLRHLLAQYVGGAPAALRFAYTPHGKPFLVGLPPQQQIQFNVAHSGDIVLIAVCKARRVGVDVERARANLDYRALAPSVFAQSELATLAALADEAGRAAFFEIWACKEAFVKAIGEGLSYPLASFSVSLAATPTLHLPAAQPADWALHALDVGAGYAAAAVSEGPLRLCCFAASVPGSRFSS
jgi:4'-phosphopantetheinyl transferase